MAHRPHDWEGARAARSPVIYPDVSLHFSNAEAMPSATDSASGGYVDHGADPSRVDGDKRAVEVNLAEGHDVSTVPGRPARCGGGMAQVSSPWISPVAPRGTPDGRKKLSFQPMITAGKMENRTTSALTTGARRVISARRGGSKGEPVVSDLSRRRSVHLSNSAHGGAACDGHHERCRSRQGRRPEHCGTRRYTCSGCKSVGMPNCP